LSPKTGAKVDDEMSQRNLQQQSGYTFEDVQLIKTAISATTNSQKKIDE